MAELLLQTDFHAAGIFAGVTLEIYLRKFAEHLNIDIRCTNKYSGKIEIKGGGRLIDDLFKYRKIDGIEMPELFNAWQTRNRCVHGKKESFTNVNNLIKVTNNLYDKICAVGVKI